MEKGDLVTLTLKVNDKPPESGIVTEVLDEEVEILILPTMRPCKVLKTYATVIAKIIPVA